MHQCKCTMPTEDALRFVLGKNAKKSRICMQDLPSQPFFSFETAVKMLAFSTLVYREQAAPDKADGLAAEEAQPAADPKLLELVHAQTAGLDSANGAAEKSEKVWLFSPPQRASRMQAFSLSL